MNFMYSLHDLKVNWYTFRVTNPYFIIFAAPQNKGQLLKVGIWSSALLSGLESIRGKLYLKLL